MMARARSRRAGPLVPALLCLALAGCLAQGPFADPFAPLPPSPEELIAEGTALLRVGEPDKAYKKFIRAFRSGGPPAQSLTGAGLALEAQGLLVQAREFLRRARDLAPESVNTQNNLGVVEYKLGDYAAARQAFRIAFAVSSGESAVALANLRTAERAIAARAPRPDLASVTHAVIPLGGGVYRLEPRAPEAPGAGATPPETPAADPAPPEPAEDLAAEGPEAQPPAPTGEAAAEDPEAATAGAAPAPRTDGPALGEAPDPTAEARPARTPEAAPEEIADAPSRPDGAAEEPRPWPLAAASPEAQAAPPSTSAPGPR